MTTLSTDDIFIAVMGMTGAGKSRFIANCTGADIPDHSSLESCTMGLTMHVMSIPNLEQRICLIDTPGFDDTRRSDADILQEVAFWLVKSYEMGIRLSGIIYLHRITDLRVGGSAVKGLKIFKEMCGSESFHGVTMATTFWDKVDDFDAARERVLELHQKPDFWKDLTDGNCTTKALTAGKTSAIELVTSIARAGKRLVLNMQHQLVDEKLLISQTDAGKVLAGVWFEAKNSLHTQLERTRKELTDAMLENKESLRQDLEQQYEDLRMSIINRNSAVKALEKPTQEMTQYWGQKADADLERITALYEETRKQLEYAKAQLQRAQADSNEYRIQQQKVDELYKQEEAADRRKNIQIASYSLNLGKAGLATSIFSAVGTALSAGVAVAPFIPVLAACCIM